MCMESVQKDEKARIIERDIVIDNMKIHIRSIFNGKISLEKALENIIVRRMNNAVLEH